MEKTDQTAIDVPAPEPLLVVVKPYRVTRGRVSAQVLIDIQNVLVADMPEGGRESALRAIFNNINWGLKR